MTDAKRELNTRAFSLREDNPFFLERRPMVWAVRTPGLGRFGRWASSVEP
jgi:hypothetical protein